ncbi:hypothetical protein [Streptococcus pneumoniae]
MHLAVSGGHVDVVLWLFSLGASFTGRDQVFCNRFRAKMFCLICILRTI